MPYEPSPIKRVRATRMVRETLRQLAPGAEIHFERLAVTEEQIATLRLPTRPTKLSDTRAKTFGPVSVELDALPAQTLRDVVHGAIERHLPAAELEQLRLVEQQERQLLHGFVGVVLEQ